MLLKENDATSCTKDLIEKFDAACDTEELLIEMTDARCDTNDLINQTQNISNNSRCEENKKMVFPRW